MSRLFSSLGSGAPAPAPAPTIASSGQIPCKLPVPWQQPRSVFETTSALKPSVPVIPLITANTTLEKDKETVLRCWLAMVGNKDVLRRRYMDGGWKMRDEPSDVVSEWCGVVVWGGRVTMLHWGNKGLTGTIPAEIGSLSALTYLNLSNDRLNGAIPPTIGALSSLERLYPSLTSWSLTSCSHSP